MEDDKELQKELQILQAEKMLIEEEIAKMKENTAKQLCEEIPKGNINCLCQQKSIPLRTTFKARIRNFLGRFKKVFSNSYL